jgi:hypothetical protein
MEVLTDSAKEGACPKSGCCDGRQLLQSIRGNPRTFRLMQCTANYWPNDDDHTLPSAVWLKLYFVLVRAILVCAVVFSLYYFATEVAQGNVVGITIALTFFLDVVSVLPTQYFNQRRLSQTLPIMDCEVLNSCTLMVEKFIAVCMLTILISIICGANDHSEPLAVVALTIGESCVVAYLAFNLWFLLMDLQVSTARIDELLALAGSKQLSLARFNAARDDIHRRVRESKWVSDFILLPCVASVISIVVLMFHVKSGHSEVTYTIGWVAALIKEMLFICVAFCFVATVNQKADELTEKLSCEVWAPIDCELGEERSGLLSRERGASDSIESGAGTDRTSKVGVTEVGAVSVSVLHPPIAETTEGHNKFSSADIRQRPSDIERLTMCVSSLTRPISFTLLFKRVSWQNVVVSFAGVALTIGVGLARSLIMEL